APRIIPLPAQLLRRLMSNDGAPAGGGATVALQLEARAGLRQVAQDLERQLYEQLFSASDGDFVAMARRLLGVATPAAARKVRLRFNQLGLRARRPRSPR
ncbi:MAG: Transcriptional regulator, partial [bacterium]|nr:Transcriptional regulator [bacterium]